MKKIVALMAVFVAFAFASEGEAMIKAYSIVAAVVGLGLAALSSKEL